MMMGGWVRMVMMMVNDDDDDDASNEDYDRRCQELFSFGLID